MDGTEKFQQEVHPKMRTLFAFCSIIVLLAVVWTQPPSQQFEPYKGKVVPDFSFQDINGKKHKLSAYRGKVVLLNFWSPH
jgi:cytochrome oxidase Cu insertion factor (SCO1/SenC/PrrC family)